MHLSERLSPHNSKVNEYQINFSLTENNQTLPDSSDWLASRQWRQRPCWSIQAAIAVPCASPCSELAWPNSHNQRGLRPNKATIRGGYDQTKPQSQGFTLVCKDHNHEEDCSNFQLQKVAKPRTIRWEEGGGQGWWRTCSVISHTLNSSTLCRAKKRSNPI